jgi:hypothetical protein
MEHGAWSGQTHHLPLRKLDFTDRKNPSGLISISFGINQVEYFLDVNLPRQKMAKWSVMRGVHTLTQ